MRFMLLGLVLIILITCVKLAGVSFFIVSSNSMKNSIPAGSLVLTAKKRVFLNDVVVFKSPISQDYIIHRVVKVSTKWGNKKINTKGDSNDKEDPWELTEGAILGIAIIKIPLIGVGLSVIKL